MLVLVFADAYVYIYIYISCTFCGTSMARWTSQSGPDFLKKTFGKPSDSPQFWEAWIIGEICVAPLAGHGDIFYGRSMDDGWVNPLNFIPNAHRRWSCNIRMGLTDVADVATDRLDRITWYKFLFVSRAKCWQQIFHSNKGPSWVGRIPTSQPHCPNPNLLTSFLKNNYQFHHINTNITMPSYFYPQISTWSKILITINLY